MYLPSSDDYLKGKANKIHAQILMWIFLLNISFTRNFEKKSFSLPTDSKFKDFVIGFSKDTCSL